MKSEKVLIIAQEIAPYVPSTPTSELGRKLPTMLQDSGRQIRAFMPRWGIVNERRNQLHEVIRLSGMNIIIDDTDHTLIIKVASIPSTHVQVYFIDNDDYFHRRQMLCDEQGVEYADNAERAIFYTRGVLETVKKLRWIPDVIHCHGWMAATAPAFIRTAYHDDPPFADAKIVFSAYGEAPQLPPSPNFKDALAYRTLDAATLDSLGVDYNSPNALQQLAVMYSDGVIQAAEGAAPDVMALAKEKGLPTLAYSEEGDLLKTYTDFYESLFSE